MTVDLFTLDVECGCAAKIPPDRLREILGDIDLPGHPDLLLGPETLDDAGVYRVDGDRCLVQTVDFFPPVARDPFVYGQVAASNALSDVYAMGGRPLTALAIVCFPAKKLDPSILKEMTRGAVERLGEAGAVLLGGHSVVDLQPKYGLAVTGEVFVPRLMDNAHVAPGDMLVLTKPIGTGVTVMAAKAGEATVAQEKAANESMVSLNGVASMAAVEMGIKSCTDITGFGLLGHSVQMADASGVSFELWFDKIPLLDGAVGFAGMGLLSGAAYANRHYCVDRAVFARDIELAEQDVLFDPQTSGGLLVACPGDRTADLVERLDKNLDTDCAVIGRAMPRNEEAVIQVERGQRT